ncbi:glycosyltransferase family 4 protein, partial [bacterium]|nr:glycosyltransferase family 4 protein [bacterium]
MNICFVCSEYPPTIYGGIGIFYYTLAKKLTDLNYDVTIVGFDSKVKKDECNIEEGIRVYRFKHLFPYIPKLINRRYSLKFFGQRIKLSNKIKELSQIHNFHIVESYDWSGPLWYKPFSPLIVRLHGAYTPNWKSKGQRAHRLIRYVERRNVKMADYILSVARHIAPLTLETLNLKNRDYTVIYNGVDLSVFKPMGLERREKQILYVGTVDKRKGVIELFQAMRIVFQEIPGAELVLIGRLPDGKKGEVFKESLLNQLNPENRNSVRFLGFIPNEQLPQWYNQAGIVVFPSKAEAFGIVPVEALACGTPIVITSRVSGPEIVKDGISGLLADPLNPEQFAAAIIKLLKDHKLRDTISRNARKRAVEMFDINKIME